MKKIGMMLVLALFVIGMLPIAFAQEAAGPAAGLKDATPKVLSVAKQEFKEKRDLVKADASVVKRGERVQALAKKKIERYRELKEFRVKVVKRTVAKQKLQRAQENFKKARDNYLKAKDKLNKARTRVENAKKLYGACAEDPESEDCLQAKDELRDGWKEKLLGHADLLIEHFEKVKSKLESNEAMSEEEVAKAVEWLDAKIAEANAIKEEIKAAEDKDALVEAAKKLHKLWNQSRVRARGFAGRVVTDKFAGIIQQAKQLQVKLNRVLEKMEEQGKDTSSADELIEQFNAEIQSAANHFAEAQDLYDKLRVAKESEELPSDYKEMREEAVEHMRLAKEALKNARALLREILQKIREANGATELSETTVEEAEDSAENADDASEDLDDDEDAEDESEDEEESEEETNETA